MSVIIATYNRSRLLDECLDHLSRQQFQPGDEVIVVDNGSTDDTAAVVKAHQQRWTAPLRLLHEATSGKSRAIARAVAVANGQILALTDDDVNVAEDWLEVLRTVLADPAVGLAGGRVKPRWEPTAPRWIRSVADRYPRLAAPIALLDYGDLPSHLGPRTLLGANIAVKRDVFIKVGGFPANLGKLRGTLLSGEDHELCRRVQAAGFDGVYCPGATVHHWVPARRARVGYILRWFYWSGITNAIMDAERAPVTGRAIHGFPFYLISRTASAAARLPAALLRADFALALDRAADVAFGLGFAAQRWGLTAARRNRESIDVTGAPA
ncbi:MAG TPA: glycosyltransferase [Vicinamibacterales bacterium]